MIKAAARRPEGSLPGAVHHDLACVHRAGASVGSVSKGPALSPSNRSMEILRCSNVSCSYHVRISYHVVIIPVVPHKAVAEVSK